MHYKTISFDDKKLKFNRGINSISYDENKIFDILAAPLMTISKLYDSNFIPFFDEESDSYLEKISTEFALKDKSNLKLDFYFKEENRVFNSWYVDNKDICNIITSQENNKPILAYYRRGNNPYWDTNLTMDYNIKNIFKESDFYPWHNYSKEFNFFAKMAIKAQYNSQDEYSVCHYSNVKHIIDEILNVSFSENFEFAIDIGKFVYYNGGYCRQVDTESYDIGITVGMIMQLYIACLQNKNQNFIGYPCDNNGIVICNYNFNERPAYSDKKWEYYNIFSKYFPNIQFIVC